MTISGKGFSLEKAIKNLGKESLIPYQVYEAILEAEKEFIIYYLSKLTNITRHLRASLLEKEEKPKRPWRIA